MIRTLIPLLAFAPLMVTSFAGTLVMGYFGLCLANHFGKLQAVELAQAKMGLLNVACAVFTLLGVLAQFLVERRRARFKQWREMWAPQLSIEQLRKLLEPKNPGKYRKAG